MNKATLVLVTLAVAIGAFGAAAWFIPSDRASTGQSAATAITRVEVTEPDRLVRPYSPILGRKDAPVTVVEFLDPACEACRAFHPTVKRILAENPDIVRVVVRYTPFHGEGSEVAIATLEAARDQNLFEPVMEALFARQREWAAHDVPASELVMGIAEEAGLDPERASRVMRSPETVGIINSDRADVEALGIRGTPTFFVNGKPLAEFGERQLIEAVEREVSLVQGS